jgi:hypothetical protein
MVEFTTLLLPTPAHSEEHRLVECVERALRATGYGALREIEVTARGCGVCLQGRVPSYYLKQVAQATTLAVPGTYPLQNALEVTRSR